MIYRFASSRSWSKDLTSLGESHLMSPHQVMAYLKTARFVAERVLPDAPPETRVWKFDARHFLEVRIATGGGGDYRDGQDYVLTGFRPYRSNLHFSIDPKATEQLLSHPLEISDRSEGSF